MISKSSFIMLSMLAAGRANRQAIATGSRDFFQHLFLLPKFESGLHGAIDQDSL